MKRLVLTLAIALMSSIAFAQNIQVQNAFNFQKTAKQYIEQADAFKVQNKIEKADKQMANAKLALQKAKDAIDAASIHEATMNQAKTWHYYAVVYYYIGAYPEFASIDMEANAKVLNAVEKIMQLDPEYYVQMSQELSSYVRNIGNGFYQLGVDSFNNGNYEDACVNFQKAVSASQKIGLVDDAAMQNLALCYTKTGKFNEAAQVYEQLISSGIDDANIYSGLINAYREAGNGEKSVEFINIARGKYPEDAQLVNDMINTYLTLHRESEIINQILEMAEKYPTQPVYYFILGTIYGNEESELFSVENALVCYDNVIKIDANYVDAYINAGSILIDQAADKYNEANDLPIDKVAEYKKMMEEGKAFDEKALPYVVKAYELSPEPAIKQALKMCYVRLKMADKAAELN
ncbi:MAG: tetratricopeptide repeat protein [Bacteroidales bacterium]|nr:tetratricopeptide repeat protein [Bacteroidales bacterium]